MRCHLSSEGYVYTQGRIMDRTHGDGNRAVSRGLNGVRLSCLQGRVNTAFLLCKIADGGSYPVLCCLLCYFSLCTSVKFVYDSLFDFEVFCCSFCMRFTSVFAAGIEEDGTSLAIAPWGSGSFWSALTAKIAEERHGLNARLQTKSYDCSEGYV